MPTLIEKIREGDGWLDYDALVATMDVEIEAQQDFGSWQGDLVYVVRRGDERGILIVGYGSCSVCDALESAMPSSFDPDTDDHAQLGDVVALRDQLQAEILWPEPGGTLASRVEAKIAADPYWAYDEPIREYVRKVARG